MALSATAEKSSHTPGPWRVSHEYTTYPGRGSGYAIVADIDGRTVSVTGVESVTSSIAPQNEANARLIAAAPDMYRVLDALLSREAKGLVMSDIIEAAHAALAKASRP